MTSPQDPPPPAQQPGAAASAPEAAQLLAAIGSLTAQVQVLSDRVQKLETRGSPDEAPEAAASDFSDAGSPGNEDDLFVPHVPGNNPFPERPPTTPLQPMLYGADRDPVYNKRFSYIKLVAKVGKEDQGLLQFVSRKIYGFGDGMVVPDTNVSGWCEEYITRKDQAFLAQAANIAARAAASAKEESPYKQPPGRGAQASGAAAPGGGGGRPKGRGH